MQHPHDSERAIDPHLAQWFVRTTTLIWGAFGIAIGVAIILGGPGRFSGISYEVAASTPGAPHSWGISIFLAGALIVVGAIWGMPRLTAVGGVIGSCWGVLFSISFILATIRYPAANNTAFLAYAAISAMFALCGAANLLMSPPKWLMRIYVRLSRKA